MVSVWGENYSQETSKGLSYWNAPLASVNAHLQESTDGFPVQGRTFFGQTQLKEASTQLWDDNNQRRYTMIALILAAELDGGERKSVFRLPNKTRI
jgi:hypothetical protein